MATVTREPEVHLPESHPPRRVKFNWVDSFLWAMRVFAIFFFAWGTVGAIALSLSGEGLGLAAWQDLIVAAISQGSMYGLIALGYSMVYGILGFINFAHGEVFMAGSLTGFFVADALATAGLWESSWLIAIFIVLIASMATSTATAVIIERVAYRRLRNSPRLIPLITSIGVSFFIQNSVLRLTGSATKTYPQMPEWLTEKYTLLGISFEATRILVIVIALIAMAGLWQFVERSTTGRAIRAVAEDKEIAALMGINVDRTIVMTFAVGGAMAGIAGVLWAIMFRGVSAFTGFIPGIKAFTAAVLGGIGNIAGAFVGGLVLGLFEGLGPNIVLRGLAWEIPRIVGLIALVALIVFAYLAWRNRTRTYGLLAGLFGLIAIASFLGWSFTIPGLSQLKDAVAFTALVLVLIFKPTGLLGEQLSSEDRA